MPAASRSAEWSWPRCNAGTYYPTEGHGFFLPANRREYYTRLLAFLGRHLGGQGAR